jgi:hypothetical protein
MKKGISKLCYFGPHGTSSDFGKIHKKYIKGGN